MTWHADATMLTRYVTGALDDAYAASVEAHLVACESCRGQLTDHAAVDRLEATWSAVVDRLDVPTPPPLESFLLSLRVPDHVARLLAATHAVGMAWLGGIAVTLAFVALTGVFSGDARVVPLFLILAPILPVIGVAVSYGPLFDPVTEVAVAAAMDSFRLLLLRALAIVTTTTVLTGVAAALLPVGGWTAVAWLLPAIALTAATLALERFIPLQVGAGLLVAGWIVAAVVSANPFRPAVQAAFSAFEPVGQIVSVAVAVASALVLLRRGTSPRALSRHP